MSFTRQIELEPFPPTRDEITIREALKMNQFVSTETVVIRFSISRATWTSIYFFLSQYQTTQGETFPFDSIICFLKPCWLFEFQNDILLVLSFRAISLNKKCSPWSLKLSHSSEKIRWRKIWVELLVKQKLFDVVFNFTFYCLRFQSKWFLTELRSFAFSRLYTNF